MQWKHPTLTRGRISFSLRQGAKIVDGVFEAPDGDLALEARLRSAGCRPVDKIIPAPHEEDLDGTPNDNEKRKAGRTRSKKQEKG